MPRFHHCRPLIAIACLLGLVACGGAAGAGPSTDASLTALVLSAGTLTPAFDPAVDTYSVTLGLVQADIALTPTTGDPSASIEVQGATVASGSGSAPLPMQIGPNPVTVQVTAADGMTQRQYTIVFTRAGGEPQEAYVKASNAESPDNFGWALAISGDTLVVGAPAEFSASTGVDGDQSDNSLQGCGAAYVFVREAGLWVQQAYLKGPTAARNEDFGFSVAISGDTVVIGARREDSNAKGVDGNPFDNTASDAGAAYVFVRTGSTWSQQAYLKASNTEAFDRFGGSVAIAGDTIAVGAIGEDSFSPGVNGGEDDNSFSSSGAAYVFVRSGTTWTQQAYVKASEPQSSDAFGAVVALDGNTLVVSATGEDSSARGIGGDETDNSALSSGAAYVFTRTGTSWSQQAYVKASNTGANDGFGSALALSGDTLVVGAPGEASSAGGIDGDEGDNSANGSGAAYVLVRTAGVWRQTAYLKASNTDAGDRMGGSVAIDGDAVLVGATDESSSGTVVDASETDNSARHAGAAYLFVRTGTAWRQAAYIKSSASDPQDLFGVGVAIDMGTLAIGAHWEDSAATGIGGDHTDNTASNSGAVYVLR